MRPYFPTKELEEENERLISMRLNSDEDISLNEFIEKYASVSFKKYLVQAEVRRKRLYAKGIIEN